MYILGISAYYHDAAAAILHNGRIVAAAQEERFSRKKNDAGFPEHSIRYCLQEAGIGTGDLDAIVFYDKPFLKFERLLETYYAYAPKGIRSFLTSIPLWIREKIFFKRNIRRELKKIGDFNPKKTRLLFPEHHLSHAASAFYPSPFTEAAILTIDGVGEWATATICKGSGSEIRILKEMQFPHSVGLLYSAFTYYLGFTVNEGEYKLMGLAPYGNPSGENTRIVKYRILNELITVNNDGSVWLNPEYFSYAYGLRMVNDKKFEKLFGFPRRKEDDPIEPRHTDMAFAIQQITEEIVIKMAIHAREITGCRDLCLAGGVALNCVANGKIQREKIFDGLFIQPAAGDAGGALGAAFAAHYLYFREKRSIIPQQPDGMQGAYLGPEFGDERLQPFLNTDEFDLRHFEDEDELCRVTASMLAAGMVVGWFQGRMEFGPRALGNRSILADPGYPGMQSLLNRKIKFRESFRPFAPAVLEEDAQRFFQLDTPSPYMLIVSEIRDELKKPLPEGYEKMSMAEKLQCPRSTLPAITHVDFSARVQTVSENTNPRFYKLLRSFKEFRGYGVLVNTSFNIKDEPIVCRPEEAMHCFKNTGMDAVVIGNRLFRKKNNENANFAGGDKSV